MRFHVQGHGRRTDVNQLAGFGSGWRLTLALPGIHQRGAEHQRRNHQFAAVLRIDRVAQLDHAMAHAVDQFLVGPRLAQLFDARIAHLQRAQAAVVIQRHRMVDVQGQYRLGLDIDTVLVEAGLDEHRREAVGRLLFVALYHLQGDRLAAQFTQLQRGNHHAAALPWQQGDDPAGRCLLVIAQGRQLVDLAGAAYFELAGQWVQVRLAELGGIP